MAKILIVEDDLDTSETLAQLLSLQSHLVDSVQDGATALNYMTTCFYDLILLDLNLPSIDGFTICRTYRESGGTAKIIMLTGQSDVLNKIEGLDLGADDYLTKPFDARELNARISSVLRRIGTLQPSDRRSLSGVVLDLKTREVVINGTAVSLKPREFSLLEFFLKHPNQVFATNALLDRLWTTDSESTEDAVRMSITRLRKQLAAVPGCEIQIETIFGIGYKLSNSGED